MHLLRTTGVICLGAPAGAYVPLPDVDLALRAEDVPASVRSSVFTADPLPLPNGGFPRGSAPTAQLGASDSGGDASLGLLQMQQTEQLRGLQLGLVTTKSALPGVDSHVYEDEAVDWWRRTHDPQKPAVPSSSASAGHSSPAPQRAPVSLVTASTSSTSSVKNAVADAQPAAVPRRRKAGFLLNSAPASVKKTSDTANHGGGGGGRRNSAPWPGASKVLEEYDVVTPPVAAEVVLSRQSESAPLVTKNKEAVTRDEQWRKRSGVGIDLVPGGRYTDKDVAYIQHLRTSAAKVNVGAANGVNYRATTAIVRPPTSTTSTAAAQEQPTEIVALNQKQQVSGLAAATRASTSASVSVSAAQCESFAKFLKENGVKGSKLIMQWHGSCEKSFPAKCSAIVAAVTPFADQLNWNVKKLCGAVMSAITE